MSDLLKTNLHSRRKEGCALLWLLMGWQLLFSEPLTPYEAAAYPSIKEVEGTGSKHWAFGPLRFQQPKIHAAWALSPIDDFVMQGLDAHRLSPAEPADPSDLLRRLYFQLTGLPPSPDERKAFIDDNSPVAVERVVDRLLESPHFGERWGRHWLDLARYADSNGLDENFLFREAWRYRNWVIKALNEDLSFDGFLLQQIAGDLLPYDSIDQRDRQRIASGFLVVGPKVLLGINPDLQRMDVAD